MSIEILGVNKSYGDFKALNNINLKIETGELIALLGPSGSGKTTLLRTIAGLETNDSGKILFNGEDNTDANVQSRKVGFVFQHYALFRNMTVFENVAFGLKVRKKAERPSKEQINKKVNEVLDLVKMKDFKDRYPEQLSGGQRQRIALARAIAVEPKVLLLDEPFGALDAKVRKELRRWLRRLHDEYSITTIFVTHDQEEAMDVADRIVIVNKGKIEQVGSPEEVYENPKNPFVYDFLGSVNIFHGRILDNKVKVGNSLYNIPKDISSKDINTLTYVRPHEIEVNKEEVKGYIKAKITLIRALGGTVYLDMFRDVEEDYVEVEIPKEKFKELDIKEGEIVYIKPKNIKIFSSNDYVI